MQLTVAGRAVRASTAGASVTPDKPLVVFVHGAGMDRTGWAMVTRAFAHRGYSVLVPDLPGHGGSDGPAPSSVEEYAAWLLDVIDEIDVGPAHLVGHSMGAAICLAAAAAAPDKVRSLVLIGTGATMPVHPDLQEAADNRDPRAVDLIMDWGLSTASQLQRHSIPGMALRESGQRSMRNNIGALGQDLRASAAYSDALAAAAKVECPTLVITGDQDRMTRPAESRPLIDALRDVEAVELERTGHMIQLERPHEVIAAIRRHLERI